MHGWALQLVLAMALSAALSAVSQLHWFGGGIAPRTSRSWGRGEGLRTMCRKQEPTVLDGDMGSDV
jgi:hypothetical protein